MSKVKLTEEQARMFENHKYAIKTLLEKRVCDNCPTSIDDMPIDDVVKAIVYGYEVEPEFKVGDFVTYENNYGDKYTETVTRQIQGFIDGENYWKEKCARFNGGKAMPLSRLRHATPEEIAEEKERRWWKKHGRDVWELKRHDILRNGAGNAFEVNSFHGNGESQKVIFKPGHFDLMTNVKESYTVVCFAENRLDVKDDE